jgi:hypothetical protein
MGVSAVDPEGCIEAKARRGLGQSDSSVSGVELRLPDISGFSRLGRVWIKSNEQNCISGYLRRGTGAYTRAV